MSPLHKVAEMGCNRMLIAVIAVTGVTGVMRFGIAVFAVIAVMRAGRCETAAQGRGSETEFTRGNTSQPGWGKELRDGGWAFPTCSRAVLDPWATADYASASARRGMVSA